MPKCPVLMYLSMLYAPLLPTSPVKTLMLRATYKCNSLSSGCPDRSKAHVQGLLSDVTTIPSRGDAADPRSQVLKVSKPDESQAVIGSKILGSCQSF